MSFVLPCAYAYVASEDISNPLTSQIFPWFVYLGKYESSISFTIFALS